jgi:hypothetical protein
MRKYRVTQIECKKVRQVDSVLGQYLSLLNAQGFSL